MIDRRDRGARLRYRAPGIYSVSGDREIGAAMVLEAVDESIREYCRRVDD